MRYDTALPSMLLYPTTVHLSTCYYIPIYMCVYIYHKIGKLLDTGLDKASIAVLLQMLENGVHPEALADGTYILIYTYICMYISICRFIDNVLLLLMGYIVIILSSYDCCFCICSGHGDSAKRTVLV